MRVKGSETQGLRPRGGSERSVEQKRESMNKNRIRGVSAGRAALLLRSPYSSKAQSVDSAIARGRRLNLPQEICPVSRKRLSEPERELTTGQKSAEGIVGFAVGEASEALQAERRRNR